MTTDTDPDTEMRTLRYLEERIAHLQGKIRIVQDQLQSLLSQLERFKAEEAAIKDRLSRK